MADIHHKASEAIARKSYTLSQTIVAQQYKLQPNQWEHFGEKHREKSTRDTLYHLSHLSQALAAGSPQIFVEYGIWCKTLFTYLGFVDDAMATTLNCMRSVVGEYLSPDQREVAWAYIDQALAQLPVITSAPASFISPDAPLYEVAQDYFAALLSKQQIQARLCILRAAQQGARVQDIYMYVLQPCQREIGRLWHMNKVSVVQEHYATAITQTMMRQLYPYLLNEVPGSKSQRIVIACVSGEFHELGARMLADFFQMAGWDTCFLGANTPSIGIIEMVLQHHASVLCLSVTSAMNVSQATETITRLRAISDLKHVRVMVGGYPFNQVPDLWRQIGADGYAPDAQSAVTIAEELVAGQKPW